MNQLKLTPSQRRRLERQLLHTSAARVYRGPLAILEKSRGRSIADVAQTLGVTRQSVYNWLHAYRRSSDAGSLQDDARSGRPSVWTPQRQALLLALLESSPDRLGYFALNWT